MRRKIGTEEFWRVMEILGLVHASDPLRNFRSRECANVTTLLSRYSRPLCRNLSLKLSEVRHSLMFIVILELFYLSV